MSDEKPSTKGPIEQALDVFFYAPLGFLMNADEVVPQLVERGRQQVQMARLFGQFAVQQGQSEAEKLSGRVQGQATGIIGQLLARAGGRPPAATRPAATTATASSPIAASAPAAPVVAAEPAPDVASLAITDYDSLSASQVVPRLAGLSSGELEAVRTYEAANRGRKTILSKVAQLQST